MRRSRSTGPPDGTRFARTARLNFGRRGPMRRPTRRRGWSCWQPTGPRFVPAWISTRCSSGRGPRRRARVGQRCVRLPRPLVAILQGSTFPRWPWCKVRRLPVDSAWCWLAIWCWRRPPPASRCRSRNGGSVRPSSRRCLLYRIGVGPAMPMLLAGEADRRRGGVPPGVVPLPGAGRAARRAASRIGGRDPRRRAAGAGDDQAARAKLRPR